MLVACVSMLRRAAYDLHVVKSVSAASVQPLSASEATAGETHMCIPSNTMKRGTASETRSCFVEKNFLARAASSFGLVDTSLAPEHRRTRRSVTKESLCGTTYLNGWDDLR